jgi:DNA damage-binding protein 1
LEYDKGLHAFAVACIRSEPGRVGEDEASTSSFKLLDDKTFEGIFLFLAVSKAG